jgi:O-succinylbenzoic acid--CoA ligase
MELIGSLSKPKNYRSILSGRENLPAIITPDSMLTYKQLDEKILSATQSLLKIGIKRRDKVAILSENNADYVITILSLWKIGAVPVPLNIRLLQNELEELVLFAGCKFLLSNDTISIPGVNVHKFPLGETTTAINVHNMNAVSETPDKFKMSNTAVIIFTSGSTGRPKGVVLTFNNLFHSAFNGNKLFNHQKEERWLASLPFYHVGGFSIISRNFFYGTTLIVPGSIKTEDIIYAIENLKPTLTSFVTTQLQRLMGAGCKPNPELRHILLGGGFIEPALVNDAIEKGWNVSKSYGTSETASFVTMLTSEEFRNKPLSAGKAIPPNEIFILDGNHNLLPNNKIGEIAIKAHSVAKGYLNNEEESKENFSGNIFYSGDYGFLDEGGYLFIEARREDLIISGGENIIPFEVEAEIIKYPGVKEVCVFGIEDKEWGHIIAAVIAADNNITIENLREFLKDKLPSFKLPRKIFILDELPKTELGKIQKGKIKERFKD